MSLSGPGGHQGSYSSDVLQMRVRQGCRVHDKGQADNLFGFVVLLIILLHFHVRKSRERHLT